MKRIQILAACAALHLAYGTATAHAQAGQGATPQAPARARVEIDLRSTAMTGTLPFDVPFEMVGNVPNSVQRIEMNYRKCGTAEECQRVATVTPCATAQECAMAAAVKRDKTQDCKLVFDDPSKWQAASLVWERDALMVPEGNQPLRFALPVDALDAQRRYVFLFDVTGPPSEGQATAFQERARETISKTLAPLQSDTNQAGWNAMKAALVADARALAPCVRIGEFLARPDADVPFRERIAKIIDNQNNAQRAVGDFRSNVNDLEEQLIALRNAPLRAMVRQLRAASANDPDLAAELQDHENLVTFINRGEAALRRIANGASPSNPDVNIQPLPNEPTPNDLLTRGTGLRQTEELLGDVQQWIRELDRMKVLEQLQTRNAMTADEIAAVRAAAARDGTLDAAIDFASTAAGAAEGGARNIGDRIDRINSIAAEMRTEIRTVRLIGSDTIGTFDTFSSWYISADAGFAYAPTVDATVPYVGANIYFRPVNKDAPLRMKGGIKRRASITLGLTLSSIADENKATRQDLFATQSLVIGGGFRITDDVRLGLGALVFKRTNPDPLAQGTELSNALYFSMSFDWDVAKQFAGIGKLFTP